LGKVGPAGLVVAAAIDTRFLTGLPENGDVRERKSAIWNLTRISICPLSDSGDAPRRSG